MFREFMAKGMMVAALLVAAAGPARAQQGAAAPDPLAKIATYEFEQGTGPLVAIEEMARHPEQKPKIEETMIAVLTNPNATVAGKQAACRLLRLVGTEKSVPALAGLLGDPKLSHMARWAMQMMPFETVDAAFAKALGELKGDLRIGVINSMGARKDVKAVGALAKLANDDSTQTADAAITTLGRVGGMEADMALAKLTPREKELAAARDDARLINADQMLKAGQTAEAVAIYKTMFGVRYPTTIRVAALRGLVRGQKEQALPLLLERMKGPDPQLAAASCKYYNEIPGPAATQALVQALPVLEPAVQVMALTALMNRGDKSAAEAASAMLRAANPDVKVAAAKAVAVLGGVAQVQPLIEAGAAGDAAGSAARDALALIHGEGVGAALLQAAGTGAPALRVRLIDVLNTRREPGAIPVLLKAAQDPAENVKQAAARALGTVAGEKDLPVLTDLLLASKDAEERGKLGDMLVSVAGRVKDKDGSATIIITKMGTADNAVKGSMLAALARLGSTKSYDVIMELLRSNDLELKKSAIRVLATWPDMKPAPALLGVARGDADASCKVLALRGYVDVVSRAKGVAAAEQVKMLKDAWDLAKDTEDKSQVLRSVANIPDPAALTLVEPFLGDSEMSMVAQYSFVKIATSIKNKNEARAALTRFIALPKVDAAIKQSAQNALKKLGGTQ